MSDGGSSSLTFVAMPAPRPLEPTIATRSSHSLVRETSDVFRVLEEDGILVVALSVGSEGYFSVYWAPASRLILEFFEHAWKASTGTPADRLSKVFDEVRTRFAAEMAERLDVTPEHLAESPPSGQLLAAAIAGNEVHVAWKSGDIALLVRDASVVDRTTPHTLRDDYARASSLTSAQRDALPLVATQLIHSDQPPSVATFRVRADDVVVLSSITTAPRIAELAHAATAGAAARATLAERLAAVAFEGDPPLYGYVVAIPFV